MKGVFQHPKKSPKIFYNWRPFFIDLKQNLLKKEEKTWNLLKSPKLANTLSFSTVSLPPLLAYNNIIQHFDNCPLESNLLL